MCGGTQAHLFVVPFLGGFRARNTPWDANDLNAELLAKDARPLMARLVDHLPHFRERPELRRRHLFLLTLECTRCLASPCDACHDWHRINGSALVELSLTLGPSTRRPARLGSGAGRNDQLVVPPNIMDQPLHTRWHIPLCRADNTTSSKKNALPSSGYAHHSSYASFIESYHHHPVNATKNVTDRQQLNVQPVSVPLAGSCRPNTASRELLLFYQGEFGSDPNSRAQALCNEPLAIRQERL